MPNRSLFSTDDPDIDFDGPAIGDMEREDLNRYQAEYDAVKATNTVLKSKCTRLWKSVLPHLDAETGHFKEGITDAERAACVEHMHSIRHAVIEVSRNFLNVIGFPVVSDADVQTYDTWIGGWKDRVDSVINPILSPKPAELPPSTPPVVPPPSTPSPAAPNVNVTLDSSKLPTSSSLPPLKLKTFSGEYSEYKLYKAVFQSLVEVEGLSEMQQACYLLDTLVKDSEPEKLMKYIDPVQPGAYAEMWTRLDEKYDKTPLGEAVYLQKLLNIAHWEPCSTDEDLNKLHDYVHENLHCLRKATGNPADGDAAKGHIWRLLPDRLKRKLTDLTIDQSTYTIDDVMKIMKKQVIHNERNFHLGGILDSGKPASTKSFKRHTHYSASNECEYVRCDFECLSCHQSNCGQTPSPPQSSEANNYPHYTPNSAKPLHCNSCSCSYQQSSFEHPPQVYFTNRSYNQRPNIHSHRRPGQSGSTPRSAHWSHPQPNYQSRHNNNSFRSQAAPRPPTSQSPPVRPERTPFVPSSHPISDICVFCDSKDHNSHNCSEYTCLDTYLDIVWDKQLCKNCLLTGHIARDCPSPRNCNLCRNFPKHSKVLCRSVQNTTTVNSYSVSMTMHSKVSSTPVFMQTAIATISNTDSGKSLRARILLDSGSNKSYISEDMAKMLDLKVLREFTYKMSTFGHEVETVKCKLVELAIWYFDTEFKTFKQVILNLMTNPQMCGKTGGISLDDVVRSTISQKGLQLADPEITHEGQFSIDILLGLDHYYNFVNSSFQPISPGLVLLSTKFGEVLAGPSLANESLSNETVSDRSTCSVVNHVQLINSGSEFQNTLGQEDSEMKFFADSDSLSGTSPEVKSSAFDSVNQNGVDLQPKMGTKPRVFASLRCFQELTVWYRDMFPPLLFILLLFLISSTFVNKVVVNHHSQVYSNLEHRGSFPPSLISCTKFTDHSLKIVNFDRWKFQTVRHPHFVLVYNMPLLNVDVRNFCFRKSGGRGFAFTATEEGDILLLRLSFICGVLEDSHRSSFHL